MISKTSISAQNTFTSRCPQVRDADWACRVVKLYPHMSSSKIKKRILNIAVNKGLLAEDQGIHYLRFLNRRSILGSKFLGIYNCFRRLVEQFHYVRHYWTDGFSSDLRLINNVIHQFRHDKLGNCGEDAYLAAAIIRMNGIENVYTASLKRKKRKVKIDHSFCIFNKDGSVFNKKDISKAIIVDPWIGRADFASVILSEYKNIYGNYLNIFPNSKLRFRKIKKINLSEPETLLLSLRFDKFRYPYTEREFMQKN